MADVHDDDDASTSKEAFLRDSTPLLAEPPSFKHQFRYFLVVWTIKIIIAIRIAYLHFFFPTPETRPTFLRTYSCRPNLPVRVFVPESRLEGSQTPLPLLLDIHEGAFATSDASVDDPFCHSWCKRTGMLVVSLNYRKAPVHRFPVPVHDVAAVARAVIDDKTLNIDKTRIIISGFSAGGNLALTACQLPELKGRIKAAISYFPIVDWSASPPHKWAKRLYTENATEAINTAGHAIDWGYVPAGQDRKSALLSPCYADRDELPKYVCLIGAQHDMLCREARDMIYSLAGEKVPEHEDGWNKGWERGTYKWMLAMGVKHGFTDEFRTRQGQGLEQRKKVRDETYASVHKWLEAKVLVS
jgi:acetyl esterase/lipase